MLLCLGSSLKKLPPDSIPPLPPDPSSIRCFLLRLPWLGLFGAPQFPLLREAAPLRALAALGGPGRPAGSVLGPRLPILLSALSPHPPAR